MPQPSPRLSIEELNKIVLPLGGYDEALDRLAIEINFFKRTRCWSEEKGVIRFPVTSGGTTGKKWIEHLEGKGVYVGSSAKSVLLSPKFQPTKGVTCNISVLKGTLFKEKNRVSIKIRSRATRRALKTPHAEIACLICNMFTYEQINAMGLNWILVMNSPIPDSDGDMSILGVGCPPRGDYSLSTGGGLPLDAWSSRVGFAFVE